jgi:hypothetical protein
MVADEGRGACNQHAHDNGKRKEFHGRPPIGSSRPWIGFCKWSAAEMRTLMDGNTALLLQTLAANYGVSVMSARFTVSNKHHTVFELEDQMRELLGLRRALFVVSHGIDIESVAPLRGRN